MAGWLYLWLYFPVADITSGIFPYVHPLLPICIHALFTQLSLTQEATVGLVAQAGPQRAAHFSSVSSLESKRSEPKNFYDLRMAVPTGALAIVY